MPSEIRKFHKLKNIGNDFGQQLGLVVRYAVYVHYNILYLK